MVDDAKLHQFIGQMLSDLGGAASIALVRIGDSLGLYKILHARGPMTVAELAAAAGVNERYLREWLSHQAASNYLSYDPATQKFTLPPEQAMVFAIEDSPVYMTGAFTCMASFLDNLAKVQPVFKTGGGVAWGDQASCLFCAVAQFFRPGYLNNLVSNWLPALDGVIEKLERGGRVADVGCGHGLSTVIMAKAFPNSQFIGYDFHPNSIEHARAHAREHGVSSNARFEVGTAKDYAEQDFDLVTFFDCLHDMGDPVGAARHIRQALDADGTWLIVEPIAGDTLADNLNPVGRIYYSSSVLVCVPNARSQPGGYALGAQAGEAAIRQVAGQAGFTRFRRAAETPFNAVFEARP